MRFKKNILYLALLFYIFVLNIEASAKVNKNPIFIGEIIEVIQEVNQKDIRLLLKGYIDNGEIYEDQIIGILNEDTKPISYEGNLNISIKDLKFEKGDKVYMELTNVMTNSKPPQVRIQKVQISKNIR